VNLFSCSKGGKAFADEIEIGHAVDLRILRDTGLAVAAQADLDAQIHFGTAVA
jgi:hypothetical protein